MTQVPTIRRDGARKMKYILIITLFLAIFILAGCADQNQSTPQSTTPTKENIVPEDQIEFSDPGSGEVGKEVKELDSLINQTSPGEYDEGALDQEVIEGTVELQ